MKNKLTESFYRTYNFNDVEDLESFYDEYANIEDAFDDLTDEYREIDIQDSDFELDVEFLPKLDIEFTSADLRALFKKSNSLETSLFESQEQLNEAKQILDQVDSEAVIILEDKLKRLQHYNKFFSDYTFEELLEQRFSRIHINDKDAILLESIVKEDDALNALISLAKDAVSGTANVIGKGIDKHAQNKKEKREREEQKRKEEKENKKKEEEENEKKRKSLDAEIDKLKKEKNKLESRVETLNKKIKDINDGSKKLTPNEEKNKDKFTEEKSRLNKDINDIEEKISKLNDKKPKDDN